MPIEIRELHIKAIVENEAGPGGGGQGSGGSGGGKATEEMIKTCIDRVLQIIEDRKER